MVAAAIITVASAVDYLASFTSAPQRGGPAAEGMPEAPETTLAEPGRLTADAALRPP